MNMQNVWQSISMQDKIYIKQKRKESVRKTQAVWRRDVYWQKVLQINRDLKRCNENFDFCNNKSLRYFAFFLIIDMFGKCIILSNCYQYRWRVCFDVFENINYLISGKPFLSRFRKNYLFLKKFCECTRVIFCTTLNDLAFLFHPLNTWLFGIVSSISCPTCSLNQFLFNFLKKLLKLQRTVSQLFMRIISRGIT